jgi:hypothetical protein
MERCEGSADIDRRNPALAHHPPVATEQTDESVKEARQGRRIFLIRPRWKKTT